MNQQFKLNTTTNNSMYKSIINILDKPKVSKNDISLAWIRAKEIDKTLKWSNFRSLKGRNEYLIDTMKKETARIKKEMAFDAIKKQRDEMELSKLKINSNRLEIDKIDRKRKRANRPDYTINFRVLTNKKEKLQSNLFVDNKKSARKIKINNTEYVQVGKEYSFTTKNVWFMNNFKSKGSKLDYIERQTRGDRWSKAVPDVMKTLEEIGAMHIISYLDAIYISKVTMKR